MGAIGLGNCGDGTWHWLSVRPTWVASGRSQLVTIRKLASLFVKINSLKLKEEMSKKEEGIKPITFRIRRVCLDTNGLNICL